MLYAIFYKHAIPCPCIISVTRNVAGLLSLTWAEANSHYCSVGVLRVVGAALMAVEGGQESENGVVL